MRPAIFSISLPIRGENAKMFVNTLMVMIRVRRSGELRIHWCRSFADHFTPRTHVRYRRPGGY